MSGRHESARRETVNPEGFDPTDYMSNDGFRRTMGLPREGSAAPAGIVLEIGDDLRIAVTDAAGRPCLTMGPFPEEDAIAVWRALGNASGLVLSIRVAGGELEAPYDQIGPVRVGRLRDRRRLAVLTGRRPRFLMRRKVGGPAPRSGAPAEG